MSPRLLIVAATLGAFAGSACGGGGSVEGTAWVLESMGTDPLLTGSVVTLSFSSDTARGSGSCNEYFGEFETEGDSIMFGPLASTHKACGEALDQQEFAYLSALQSAETYEVSEGRLTIDYPGGVLSFAAAF
ncbi:MAG: META domain-containing protein [Acidimicrobiia bacterium]